MAQPTREEKLKKKVVVLEEQLRVTQDEYDDLFKTSHEYRQQIQNLHGSLENLRNEFNRIAKQEEDEMDVSKQTIIGCTKMLERAYNKIVDPITRREAFKQMMASVIDGEKKFIEKQRSKMEEANSITEEALQAREDSLDNVEAFMDRIKKGNLNYHTFSTNFPSKIENPRKLYQR